METDFAPIFTMTGSELAGVLMAFSGHVERVGRENPQLDTSEKFVLVEGAINEFIANLAASLAEGLSLDHAAQNSMNPMIPCELPPEIVAAWWRGWHHGRRAHLIAQPSESDKHIPQEAGIGDHE